MCSMPYILLHIFANSNLNFAFIFYKLTPWCSVLTDKLIAAHLLNKSPPTPFFFVTEESPPYASQMNPVWNNAFYFSTINSNTIPATHHSTSNLEPEVYKYFLILSYVLHAS